MSFPFNQSSSQHLSLRPVGQLWCRGQSWRRCQDKPRQVFNAVDWGPCAFCGTSWNWGGRGGKKVLVSTLLMLCSYLVQVTCNTLLMLSSSLVPFNFINRWNIRSNELSNGLLSQPAAWIGDLVLFICPLKTSFLFVGNKVIWAIKDTSSDWLL